MVVTQYQHIRPIVHRGSAVIFCIILLQFKPSCLKGIICLFIGHPLQTIWNHHRMQYTLFNLYRSEIAEILGVSQLALALSYLAPYTGQTGTLFFFLIFQICIRFQLSFIKGPCDNNKYQT